MRLTLSGFDTHANQPPTHARLLAELADGLTALCAALVELGKWNDTLVLTYAEFGRRPKENRNSGTDHGTANVQFALGAIDACGFWCGIYGSGACHSHAPLIDQVKFYRIAFAGPQGNVRDIHLFQDTFPENGGNTGPARGDRSEDRLDERTVDDDPAEPHLPVKFVQRRHAGAEQVSEPRGEERYCHDCWDKKIAVEEIVAKEFVLKRYIRAQSAEKYLIYHSTLKRPCGQLIVIDDGYDLFLTLSLYPSFLWDDPAYHLESDPELRTFAEIMVDVIVTEVIEPWGGGEWHLEVHRSATPDPEEWNGEV